jgi:hypothetical protein
MKYIRFVAVSITNTKITVFLDMTRHIWVQIYKIFEGACCPLLHGSRDIGTGHNSISLCLEGMWKAERKGT